MDFFQLSFQQVTSFLIDDKIAPDLFILRRCLTILNLLDINTSQVDLLEGHQDSPLQWVCLPTLNHFPHSQYKPKSLVNLS